jgi:hypothetical protein
LWLPEQPCDAWYHPQTPVGCEAMLAKMICDPVARSAQMHRAGAGIC